MRYAHWGVMQSVSGASLDERAEVGLLTRNITIQGDSASLTTGIGGHVMVMQGATAHVEGVTFTRMGQKARLARYPMHWHMAGAVDGQYFRNNSVWKSFNRCLTVHGTDNVVADGNVCHDHIGHGFFLEDGAESGNTFTGNLVMTTRAPASGRGGAAVGYAAGELLDHQPGQHLSRQRGGGLARHRLLVRVPGVTHRSLGGRGGPAAADAAARVQGQRGALQPFGRPQRG